MKKKTLSIVLMVSLLLIMTTITAFANGKVIKSTGKDAPVFLQPCDVFGGAYCNAYQIPTATGKVNVIQPNGDVDMVFGIAADGLLPNTQYRVIFGVYGSWTSIGYFFTDEYGSGSFNYTVPAGTYASGEYAFRVWLNRYDPNYTVLVSETITFVIE